MGLAFALALFVDSAEAWYVEVTITQVYWVDDKYADHDDKKLTISPGYTFAEYGEYIRNLVETTITPDPSVNDEDHIYSNCSGIPSQETPFIEVDANGGLIKNYTNDPFTRYLRCSVKTVSGADFPYTRKVNVFASSVVKAGDPAPPEDPPPDCPEGNPEYAFFGHQSLGSYGIEVHDPQSLPDQVCVNGSDVGGVGGQCLYIKDGGVEACFNDGCVAEYKKGGVCDPTQSAAPPPIKQGAQQGPTAGEPPLDQVCGTIDGHKVCTNKPGSDPESQCAFDSNGNAVACLDDPVTVENESTGEVQTCPQGSICGYYDHDDNPDTPGVFGSVGGIDQTNCGTFNGQQVCLDDNGSIVDESSPDHPTNGGNLNGDDTDDYLDPTNPGDGLSDSDQNAILADRIEGAIQSQTDQLIASAEQLQQENHNFLEDTFTEDVEADVGTFNGNQVAIETSVGDVVGALDSKDDLLNQAQAGDGLAGDSRQYLNARGQAVEGLLSIGACQDYRVNFGDWTLELECSTFGIVRTVLAWAFWGMLVIYTYFVVTQAFKEATD